MPTCIFSFALWEMNRDSWKWEWKISQIQELLFPSGLAHKILLAANSSASNTFTVLLRLPPSPISPLFCFSPPPPILVDMLQLKVAPDECSFEISQAVGTSRRVLYVRGFLVKLRISPLSMHLHCLRLYPSTAWWLAEIVIYSFTIHSILQHLNHFRLMVCPSD